MPKQASLRQSAPEQDSIKIAIIGWGSLIKEPRELPIEGGWQVDSPKLWIEFSRISPTGIRSGCLTAVIDERCETKVPTQYALSQRTDLVAAIADLQAREWTLAEYIGSCEVGRGRITTFRVYITNGVSSDWHEFLTSANQILLAAAA